MRRLIVNPGTDSAWEIPLRDGTATLGRLDDNDFVLADPSVSSHHCKISVQSADIVIKDLGSSNGTFIDGEPVTESPLLPGQSLRLGEVQLRLEAAAPVAVRVAVAPPAPLPAATASGHCKFHPRNTTRYFCPKCHGSFCELCVNVRAVAGTGKHFCRACAAECTPVEIPEEAPAATRFTSQIGGAFKYPFKGDGLILICAGTMLLLLVDGARSIARFAPLYGFIAVIMLTVFGTGYLTAFLRRVITSTAHGEEEMPEWPEIQDYGSDVVAPFLQFIGTVVFCFAPAIGFTIYALVGSPGDSAWLGWPTTHRRW
jgi:hypothetical protein